MLKGSELTTVTVVADSEDSNHTAQADLVKFLVLYCSGQLLTTKTNKLATMVANASDIHRRDTNLTKYKNL